MAQHFVFKDLDATNYVNRINGTITGTFTLGENLTGNQGSTATIVAQGTNYVIVRQGGDSSSNWTTDTSATGDGSGASISITGTEHYTEKYSLSSGYHPFYNAKIQLKHSPFNRQICVNLLPDTSGTLHSYSGTYNDTTEQNRDLGIITDIFEDPSVDSDAEALERATDRYEFFNRQKTAGSLLAPMHCAHTIGDIIAIEDVRSDISSGEFLITSITRTYIPGKRYDIELGFGDMEWSLPTTFNINEVANQVEEVHNTQQKQEKLIPPPKPSEVIKEKMTFEKAKTPEVAKRQLTPTEIHEVMPFVKTEDVAKLRRDMDKRKKALEEEKKTLSSGQMSSQELKQTFPWIDAEAVRKQREEMKKKK